MLTSSSRMRLNIATSASSPSQPLASGGRAETTVAGSVPAGSRCVGIAPDLAINSCPLDGEWPRKDWRKTTVTTGKSCRRSCQLMLATGNGGGQGERGGGRISHVLTADATFVSVFAFLSNKWKPGLQFHALREGR